MALRFHQRRLAAGLNQSELAYCLGVTRQTIVRLERAERDGEPIPKLYDLAMDGLELLLKSRRRRPARRPAE